MRAVVDASSLIALARIGYLWVLERGFDSLIISEAVYDEVVTKGADKAGVEEIKKAKWISSKEVQDKKGVSKLADKLHWGESETIVLAQEIGAEIVILDEELARRVAKSEDLKSVGILALLVEAKRRGWVSSVGEAIKKLEEQQFFIKKGLKVKILEIAGELWKSTKTE